MISDHVVLAHMVHPDNPTDIEILQRTNTNVVHNPTSNAKLADGIAPIPDLVAQGVKYIWAPMERRVTTHTTFSGSMHLAGVIHKARLEDASIMSSEQILDMATSNGVKSLGLEKDLGRLEVGKKADFVVIDLSGLHASPYDAAHFGQGGIHPATVIVHSCTGRDVGMVVLDGKVVAYEGELLHLNEEEVKRSAIAGIRARSNVQARLLKRGWHYV